MNAVLIKLQQHKNKNNTSRGKTKQATRTEHRINNNRRKRRYVIPNINVITRKQTRVEGKQGDQGMKT